jgi:tRNA modification GTPase
MYGDTIVALSTPAGNSGIAVIRISGPDAAGIIDAMAPGAARWAPRTIHNRTLRGRDGEPIDDVVAALYRAPDSYTGEDTVEISCHGSMLVVRSIVEEALAGGARLAGAGEFTRRAFASGKLDLAQAEAVADLIASETRLQARVALEHLGGGLSRRVEAVEEQLRSQLALVEASIDFPEEDIEVFSYRRLSDASKGAREELSRLIESEAAGGRLRDGVRVTITGPRNAGKSSLYNALLGEERAIVSALPGTTRDVLRERIHIGGFTYYLEDTAGLAETDCDIESEGMRKGREAAGGADLVIFVVDAAEGWSATARQEIAAHESRNLLVAVNKADLEPGGGGAASGSPAGMDNTVVVSAVTGEGLGRLRERVFELTAEGEAMEVAGERIAVNIRQAEALRRAEKALGRLEKEIGRRSPAEILSVEVREALDACGEVTGRSRGEDILDEIFSNFCIGK